MEEDQKFLHGTLEATIFHATPHTPVSHFNCWMAGGKAAYVTIMLNRRKVAKTSPELNYVWNQKFQILCAHPSDSTIIISMKTKHSILGRIRIEARQILNGSSCINGLFPLNKEDGKPNMELRLHFVLRFKPARLMSSWNKLLNHGEYEYQGLKTATFPIQSNCSVVLYQDAHQRSDFRLPFNLPARDPRKLWEDVYKAIEGAKLLIYIAGWSFNPKIELVRDSETKLPYALGVQLGDLLKSKAEDGVAVRIMIWDDETSLPLIKNKGIMNTSDEDAFAYFKHTKVICRLCPRLHDKLPTVFTHHQKTITVDIQSHHSPLDREIMSFIGGLDLCGGRYDTEEHSLFRTLNTRSHCRDFYQSNINEANINKGGPREPWHDVHASITGEAACDILKNFEQRWSKQSDPSLLVSTTNTITITPSQSHNWRVQVLRSIDNTSTTHSYKKFNTERSIYESYVEAIRRAERFIYIENQYFSGGCHMWERDKHCGCTNLIPVEIALKVVNKIKARERFAVYIVIPMWPEGVPEGEAVQDILHWTRETMAMMYKLVGEAIKENGQQGHPTDYLNFFCLANREEMRRGEFIPPCSPHPNTLYWNAQKYRRFMVYVHSKLMIVDDIYLLIGSANLNQRSMDGQRDTEIAIGCYQSKNGEKGTSRGDIHSYRMSLWYEHTKQGDELFKEPHSLECVKRMRSMGDQMWKFYSDERVVIDMEGVHLVTYPVTVTEDGFVEELVGSDGNFPDTKAKVKGQRSKVLPPIFTT